MTFDKTWEELEQQYAEPSELYAAAMQAVMTAQNKPSMPQYLAVLEAHFHEMLRRLLAAMIANLPEEKVQETLEEFNQMAALDKAERLYEFTRQLNSESSKLVVAKGNVPRNE